jgi:hypothetical protein
LPRPSRRNPNWSSDARRRPGPRPLRKALLGCALGAALAAIAVADGRGDFGKTLLYALCTIAVVIAATGVTIGGAARLGKSRPGWGDRPGYIEAGLLIGVFAIAPAALSGAFVILNALVGPP